MSGLINEIQKGSLDDTVSVESLLRRVKLAASKLKLGALEAWVDSELNGYIGEVPEHRTLYGQPAAWHQTGGWMPIQIEDAFFADLLSTAKLAQSVGSLRDMIEKSSSRIFHFPFPPELVANVSKLMSYNTARIVVQIPRGGIVSVLDSVRNKVLDWAIEMERNGVMGEDFSFEPNEVESAKAVMTTFNIGKIDNFAGNMGSGNSSGDISLTTNQLTEVLSVLQKLREESPNLVALGAEDTLPVLIDSAIVEADNKNPEIGKLRGLAQDVRSALAGAAGNLTAEGAMSLIGGVLRILGGA